ncbi:hypothetical protein F511_03167 [Dorcoceras hygrometricum]|nr:hypothetical protein F511_03167 [Dorcoceras hygrometricum]
MAIKSTLFLLAFVLLATRMASSMLDVDATKKEIRDLEKGASVLSLASGPSSSEQ